MATLKRAIESKPEKYVFSQLELLSYFHPSCINKNNLWRLLKQQKTYRVFEFGNSSYKSKSYIFIKKVRRKKLV